MPLRRLNQDAHYKQAICDVIDFKHLGLMRLFKVLVLRPCTLFVRAPPAPRLIRVYMAGGVLW